MFLLKGENIWAAIKGAFASTFIIFIMLIMSVLLIPSTPQDDAHIRGAVTVVVFLPLVLGVLFLYYLTLSVKNNRPFKFALLVQTVMIIPIAAFIFYVAYLSGGFLIALVNSIYTFVFFSIVGVFGAWVWSKPKKHITNSSN